uniref:Neuroblastoma-amplified sequence n=2 Tax=Lygus hesperus TaxID=30085 RepID=A0A0A9XRG0_LYGHE
MSTVLNDEVPILYELLVYEEWLQDPEPLKPPSSPVSSLSASCQKCLSYLRHAEWPSGELTNALSPLIPWQIALSPNGLMVAILQEALLEVRTHEDDFTSTVGKAALSKDVFPQLRLLKWHPENDKIAVSSSTGIVTIFDAFCNHLYTIVPLSDQEMQNYPRNFFVAGIEFIESENPKKIDLIIVVYSNGLIKTFTLSDRDILRESHRVQLNIDQISCAIYNKHFNILLLASQPQPTTTYFQDSCFSAGLSAWRMISEYPFYKMLFPSEEESKMLHAGGKLWKLFSFSKLQGVAVKLSVSQNNQFLASLHACNTIIIWLIPSLRMYRKWCVDETEASGQDVALKVDKAPVDIGWRQDEKLIVSRKDGSISVHHIETFEVCYGSGSELLSGYPRITSTEHFPGFVTLECDSILLSPSPEDSMYEAEKSIFDTSSEMIQNTIYYITDLETFQPKKKSVKVIQKVYRMIGVKSTTPEELFWRKLDSDEYTGALELAEEFGLNSDEVYKKLWRTSAVSSFSISDNLSKIRNKSWVLNECTERVPESFSGAEELFKFGFNETCLSNTFDKKYSSPKNLISDPSFSCDSLDELQKEKIITRVILLNYADKLRAYKEILGGNPDIDRTYDMVQYDRFRKLPIVESAIYFARQCNIKAVEVILKYYTADLTPHLFYILENIPEICDPSDYSYLLPKCDAEGHPAYWEVTNSLTDDWSRHDIFRRIIPPSVEIVSINKLPPALCVNGPMLSKWYRERALAIEFRSKLLHNAQSLIRLGIERNIKGLEELNSNFKTLECMIYELELDVDTHAFLHMTDLEKSVAMMDKTAPEDFTYKMLKYFVPFLNRHGLKNEERYQLYFDFLIYTSQENLKSSLSFIGYVLDENYDLIGGPEEIAPLIVECIYNYSKLDLVLETIEVIDNCVAWITNLPKDSRDHRNLLTSLKILRDETLAAQIATTHGISTTVNSIHRLKSGEDKPKRILQQMTTSIVKEYFKSKSISKVTSGFKDILSVQEVCFNNVGLEDCYEMYASSLLNSGSLPLIELSNSVICSKKEVESSCFLSFDHSIKLVLHAAERYFDTSESVEDEAMSFAKACLFLIKDDHVDINTEIDLIQGLRYLNEIGVHLIPIQVRQSEDRMKLLHLCFDKNRQLYKKSHFVYKLGAKLRVCGDDMLLRHNMITEKLAKVSLSDGAISFCSEFCSDLIVNNYSEGWKVVFELLKTRKLADQSLVKAFWSFCAIHAPSRFLNDLVSVRNSISLAATIPPNEGIVQTVGTPVSLVNTPDSDNWEDYQLASSDSSHKLDEASDAEPTPTYCGPFFYSDNCDSSEYAVAKKQILKNPIFQILHVTSEESLFPFVEAHNFCIDPWIVDTKLIELAARYLNKDTLTALGFLLNTSNPLSCEDFFDKLPQGAFAQELAVYYYATCSLRDTSSHTLSPPYEVVYDELTLDRSEFRSSIAKYAKKHESLLQAKSLKEENCGVNYERFMEDESYKTDTIYGLAMSPDKLGISFELARKNGIPLWEIAMTHIKSLFFDDNVDLLIKTSSENIEMAMVLESHTNVISNRLQSLFDIIDGTDYKKLTNFFKIIQCLNVELNINDLTAKEHMKLLKKVESTVSGLNYKDLVSKKKDLLSLLKPYLVQSETVGNCVKFAKSVPKSLKVDFSTSSLYYEFSLHQFHTLCLGCTSLKQCASNFETIYPSLAKLNQKELLEFVQSSICGEEVVAKLDYVTRRQLLNSLLQWCQGANDMRSTFESLAQYIQDKLERLNVIWNDDEEDVLSNVSLKKYLCEVESYDPTDDFRDTNHFKCILDRARRDPGLSRVAQRVLKRVVNALEPLSGLEESHDSSFSEDDDKVAVRLETLNPESTSQKGIDNLDAIRTFCEKFVADHPETTITSFDYETLADTGITSAMFKYMFSTECFEENDSSEARCSIDDVHFSKYEVARAIFDSDIPPIVFQKLAETVEEQLAAGLDSDCIDTVFLVWLCLSCEQLNLHDQGGRFLNEHFLAKQLVHFVGNHPECAEKIVPSLITTTQFANVASSLLGEGNTQTVRRLIEVLQSTGMSAEAGALRMSASRVPAFLRTFGSSLWFKERRTSE